jgi:hypothetical protein
MKRSDLSRKPDDADQGTDDRLDRYWAEFRKENYEQSFPVLPRLLVRNKAARAGSSRRWHWVSLRPALAALAVVLLVGAGNIPVSTTSILGFSIQGTSDLDESVVSEAVQSLNLPAPKSISTGFNGINTQFSILLPAVSESQVTEWMATLHELLPDVQIRKSSHAEEHTIPLYSALLQTLNITVDATGLANEEVISRIESQLNSLGVDNAIIEQSTSPEGDATIDITIPSPSGNQ